ncbi:hypothetical protein EPR50_G00020090 [Perca flavescens]|uniref:Uncharacterized protein n=1 Tax=Perca flavescens TaxID=8167 RepID=A0A484DP36_PERFV|nr:hypothetical protein EPR50_G00020090 [Perca flavescens]
MDLRSGRNPVSHLQTLQSLQRFASRDERRGVPCTADSRHTAAASSSSSSFCTEAGLLCPINSTDSQLLLSPSKPLLHPPSTGCTQIDPRSSPVGLTQ